MSKPSQDDQRRADSLVEMILSEGIAWRDAGNMVKQGFLNGEYVGEMSLSERGFVVRKVSGETKVFPDPQAAEAWLRHPEQPGRYPAPCELTCGPLGEGNCAKCPNCGGAGVYIKQDTKKREYECENCGTNFYVSIETAQSIP